MFYWGEPGVMLISVVVSRTTLDADWVLTARLVRISFVNWRSTRSLGERKGWGWCE